MPQDDLGRRAERPRRRRHARGRQGLDRRELDYALDRGDGHGDGDGDRNGSGIGLLRLGLRIGRGRRLHSGRGCGLRLGHGQDRLEAFARVGPGVPLGEVLGIVRDRVQPFQRPAARLDVGNVLADPLGLQGAQEQIGAILLDRLDPCPSGLPLRQLEQRIGQEERQPSRLQTRIESLLLAGSINAGEPPPT